VALGKDGRIAEQGTFAELNARDGSYVQSFALQQAARGIEEAQTEPVGVYKLGANQASTEDTVGDKSRQMGDFSVYKYYFAATGRLAMIIFWALEILWAFLETFPSVWLKWWSSSTTNNENPSTAKYLGVYAVLQVGSLLTLFVLAM
jgi:ATP-binding cassette, subfamily C (CFTR/MRP), member 1